MPIPEFTEQQRYLILCGLCPFCEQPVRRYAYDDPFVFDRAKYETDPTGVNAPRPVQIFKCRLCGAETTEPMEAKSWDKHREGCRWHDVNPNNGHSRRCPHPEITIG